MTLAAGVPTIWLGILDALEKNPGRWKLRDGIRMVVGGSAAPGGDDPRDRQATASASSTRGG